MASDTRAPDWIGVSTPRLGGERFVSGTPTYSADLIPADALHMALVRSPHRHARILSVDRAAATACPGVSLVMTGTEVAALSSPMPPCLALPGVVDGRGAIKGYCLAEDRVLYVGHPVAVVVADSLQTAEQAADLTNVRYEILPPVTDPEAALLPGSVAVHDGWTTNLVAADRIWRGDPSAALAEAATVVEGEVVFEATTSAPLEPIHYLARWDASDDRLTLRGTLQNPHATRWLVAHALNLRESQVRVVAPPLGGSFGLKMSGHPEEALVGLLARLTGRPVSYWADRRETLRSPSRTQRHRFRAAAGADGRITALAVDMLADVGVVGPGNGWSMAMVSPTVFPTVYDIANVAIDSRLAATNNPPWEPVRGYGKEIANLVTERAVEAVAGRLGLDPALVRRRNLIAKDAFPHRLPSGLNLDSGDYAGTLDQLLALFGYEEWQVRQRRQEPGDTCIGIGLAFELTPEGGARPGAFPSGHETATIRLLPGGEVQVATGVTSPGSGNETGIAQLVAGPLGIHPHQVSVLQGDTDVVPLGTGHASSRAILYGGTAARLAAEGLREKILRCGANMLDAPLEHLHLSDGYVSVAGEPYRRVSLAEIGLGAHTRPFTVAAGVDLPLEVTRSFRPINVRVTPDEQGRIATYSSFPYSVHAIAIELDRSTGCVAVRDYAAVHDCGVVLNPDLVDGQLRGAIAMGIGAALWERLAFAADGTLLADRFKTYLLPRAPDLPRIRLGHASTPTPYHPLGLKGVGESGFSGAMSAAVNAVWNALGRPADGLTVVPTTAPVILRLAGEQNR